MALITKIRNNSWLLVTVIGLALAAFVFMDMTSSGNRRAAGDFTMGTVNGQPIDYKEFQRAETALYSGGGNSYANRNYLWNYFVEKSLVDQYAEKLGLGVSKDELMELQFGNNLSPVIQQRFMNQQTGQVDRASLNNLRQLIESNELQPSQRDYWAVQEREIVTNATQNKVNTMVSKGIYAPTWYAEYRNNAQQGKMNIEFVKVPLTSVDDSQIEVSDEDVSNYLKDHYAMYKQKEETRIADYAVFDIKPTKQDTADIIDRLVELKNRMIAAESDSVFVRNNEGIYPQDYVKAAALPAALKDVLMDLPVGDTYGPFMDNGQYQLVRVLDKKIIPDSVESRHILRPVKTQEEFIAASALLDSLKTEIEKGTTTFVAAAEKFGTDATRTSGGDLGYSAAGRMVKPFNDLIFFTAKKGELYILPTQFGLHLVEVTGQKFDTKEEGVRYSTLAENIVPSAATQRAEYDRVVDIISQVSGVENLKTALSGMGMSLQKTPPLKQNDYNIPGVVTGNTGRDIVRWMYTPGIKVGETSPEVYIFKDPTLFYDSKLFLVGLAEINSGDLPSIAAGRAQVETLIRNQKKADMIASNLKGTDMSAAASQYGVEVQQAPNVTLDGRFIPGLGSEPALQGAMASMNTGDVMGPFAGTGGVYYVRMGDKTPASAIANLGQTKRGIASSSQSRVGAKLWEAVKNAVNIEDKRYTFF